MTSIATMDYDEAMAATVNKAEAKAEIDSHDCDGWDAFIKDVGERETYKGSEVLGWLGY